MLIRIALLCLLAMTATAAESISGTQRADRVAATLVGRPAPALKLRGVDGNTIDLGAYLGKRAVYLKFWATWCGPCIQQMPHFQHAHETAGTGLVVIGINAGFNDTPALVHDTQRKLGMTMPMAIDDGSAAAAFDLRVTPMHVIIDRAGIVRFVGHLADARVDRALVAAKTSAATTAPRVQTGNAASFQVGSRVQAVRLQPLDSPPLGIPVKAGRPTVLVFTSDWCESYLQERRPDLAARCTKSREQLTALPAALRAQADWVWISSEIWSTEAELRDYRDAMAIKAPVVLDRKHALFNTFQVRDVPTVLVIDGAGVVEQRLHGDESDLLQRLQRSVASAGRAEANR